MKLETIIGLEFHVQLKTKTKMFCACPNEPDLNFPNKNICPICLGHPGVLPVVNEEAINMAMRAALALNCTVESFTKFDRKNYFYPDLPKGYQISQYDKPLATNGYLVINIAVADGLAADLSDENQLKKIGIIRLHLEEDAAKSVHQKDGTLIDFNRGGAPLIEIVTSPHFSSPQEAKTFAQELQLIMRQLEISDADMEKGQLRCDANISLRPVGDKKLYPKTEIKNINSFRAIERALAFEVNRQTILWSTASPPTQSETRGWDDAKQETTEQRAKEGESDYRYFPEPDLPPLTLTDKQIAEIKALLPELPQAKRRRFMEMYEFSLADAKIITENKELANYTEKIISELKEWLSTTLAEQGTDEEIWQKNKRAVIKLVANWLINKFLAVLGKRRVSIGDCKVTPENFAEFITLVYENKINSSAAQTILEEMLTTGADPEHILAEKDLGQMAAGGDELAEIAKRLVEDNPEQAKQYQTGKEALLQFFLGLIMKETKGKANPQEAETLLKKLLK